MTLRTRCAVRGRGSGWRSSLESVMHHVCHVSCANGRGQGPPGLRPLPSPWLWAEARRASVDRVTHEVEACLVAGILPVIVEVEHG
jgi:hypothetical protein